MERLHSPWLRRPKDPEAGKGGGGTQKGKDEEEIAPTIQCGITFPNDLIPLAVRLEEVRVWGHGVVWKEQEEIQTA